MALRPGLILSISLLQVVLCFLSLAYAQTSVTTNATAGERHSEEYCAMYGICGKRSDGKYLNCPFGSPSVKPDDLLSSKVQSLCPTITGNVCCTETQFDTLRSQVQQAIPFLVGCPACLRNFLNLFCELTCSPSQSLFINVTSVAKHMKLLSFIWWMENGKRNRTFLNYLRLFVTCLIDRATERLVVCYLLNELEITEAARLLDLLEGVRVITSRLDKRRWKLDPSGLFTCHSFCSHIQNCDEGEIFSPYTQIWKAKTPPKVKIFVWQAVLGKLNTGDTLQRRCPYLCISPHWCALCNKAGESVDHLLIHCPFSLKLWETLLKEVNTVWVIPEGCFELFSIRFDALGRGKKAKILWGSLMQAVVWNLWLERNRRIFEDYKGVGVAELWDRVKFWAALWDILRFHAVYWPAMLMSAGLGLPKMVFGHGFLTKDGMKMGKSLGNTIEPNDLVHKFGSDAVRYFFLREVEFGNDGDYSEDRFINIVNAHLANSIGNLLNRTLGLLKKNCQSTLVVDSSIAAEGITFKDTVEKLVEKARVQYGNLSLSSACEAVLEISNAGNLYMDERAPWSLFKQGGAASEAAAKDLVIILEAMRIIAVALSPVTPSLSWRIYGQLGYSKERFDAATWSDTKWGGLKSGQVMAQPTPIFARIENPTEGQNAVEAPKKEVKKDKLPQAKRVVEA